MTTNLQSLHPASVSRHSRVPKATKESGYTKDESTLIDGNLESMSLQLTTIVNEAITKRESININLTIYFVYSFK